MAENSKIEWTHHTSNPWRGCTKVSAGCKHCYAETLSGRNPGTLGIWGKNGTRVIAVESYWKQPIKWNRDAEQAGERRRVFCASLADVFEGPESMPAASVEAVTEARRRLFGLILDTPHLDWLLLTKRPENIPLMAPMALGTDGPSWMRYGFPANVWIGTSVEDQEAADKRIPVLLKVPAQIRFLSCEPLLGPVDLGRWPRTIWNSAGGTWITYPPNIAQRAEIRSIDWVIVGGESGGGARPMHPEWARGLRDQCVAAGVAFHFKQWGEYKATRKDVSEIWGRHYEFLDQNMERVGKKAAGRVLDGRTWDEYPEVIQ